MELSKKHKKVLKRLSQVRDSSKYVLIEELFGREELAHKKNSEFQKIINDLISQNFIEIQGGEHLFPPYKTNDRQSSYTSYYTDLKARITPDGKSILIQNKPDWIKILPIIISLGTLIVLILNYCENPLGKETTVGSSKNSDSSFRIEEMVLDSQGISSNLTQWERVFIEYDSVKTVFDGELVLLLTSVVSDTNKAFRLELSTNEGSKKKFYNILKEDSIKFFNYIVEPESFKKGNNESSYKVGLKINKVDI